MNKKLMLMALFISIFVTGQSRIDDNLQTVLNHLNGPGNIVIEGTGNVANGRDNKFKGYNNTANGNSN